MADRSEPVAQIRAGQPLDKLPGLSLPPRRLQSGIVFQEVDWRDHPERDEAWADEKSLPYHGRKSPWWKINMERELTRGGQPAWPMLERKWHVSDWPSTYELRTGGWAFYRSLDHGTRHPTCCAWVAVNEAGDKYFYRQYYKTDATIAFNAKRIVEMTPRAEPVVMTVADPSIWKRDSISLRTYADEYMQSGLQPFVRADNAIAGYETVTAGFIATIARHALGGRDLDILREALGVDSLSDGDAERLAGQPAIWFSPECAAPRPELSLYQQCKDHRWREQVGDPTHKAAPERYEDVDDEGPDVVRYACHSQAVCWRQVRRSVQDRIAHTIERMLSGPARAKRSRWN